MAVTDDLIKWCESPLSYGNMYTTFKFSGAPAWTINSKSNNNVMHDIIDLLTAMSGYWCEQIVAHHIVSERSPSKEMLTKVCDNTRNAYFGFVDVWWTDIDLKPNRGDGGINYSVKDAVKSEISRVLDSTTLKASEGFLPPTVAPSSTFVPNEIMIHSEVKFAYRDLITQEAVRLTNANAPIALGPVLWEIIRLLYLLRSHIGKWRGELDELSLLYWVGRLFSVCVCGLHARNYVIRYMTPRLNRRSLIEIERSKSWPIKPRDFDDYVLPLYCSSTEDGTTEYRNMSIVNALHESIRLDARSEDGQARHDTFGLAGCTPQFSDAYYVTLCANSVPLLPIAAVEEFLFTACIAPYFNNGKRECTLHRVRNAYDIITAVNNTWKTTRAYAEMNNDDEYSPMIHPSSSISIVHEATEVIEKCLYEYFPVRSSHAARVVVNLCEQARYMMNPSVTWGIVPSTASSMEASDVPKDWWACFLLFWSIYSSRLSGTFCKTYIGNTSIAALSMANLQRTEHSRRQKQHYSQVDPTTGKRAPVGMLAIRDFLTYAANSPSLRKHRCVEVALTSAITRSYITDPTMDTMLVVLKTWLYAETGLTICDFLYNRVNVLGIYNKR